MADQDPTPEEWRAVVGFEGLYEVSSAERVRSLRSGKLIGFYQNDGYRYIALPPAWRLHIGVHRLVLMAFIGPEPAGCECCHNNGIRDDNRLENLRWDTSAGNQHDRVKHGTAPSNPGERNGMARLDEKRIRVIRILCGAGFDQRAVAEMFKCRQPAISRIASGKRWGHVT